LVIGKSGLSNNEPGRYGTPDRDARNPWPARRQGPFAASEHQPLPAPSPATIATHEALAKTRAEAEKRRHAARVGVWTMVADGVVLAAATTLHQIWRVFEG
jgi:hypothetical protein